MGSWWSWDEYMAAEEEGPVRAKGTLKLKLPAKMTASYVAQLERLSASDHGCSDKGILKVSLSVPCSACARALA